MVMSLAIGKSTLFVVPMAQERLFALGAHEMLDMPMLAEGGDDAFFDRSTASAADWNSHAIMTTQTVQLVHVIRGEASSALNLARCRIQLDAATGAIEMIAVVDLPTKAQRRAIDESVTLLARILSDLRSFNARVASMTQRSIVVPYEARIGELLGA